MNKRLATAFLMLVLAVSVGCGGLPKTHYYIVESPHVHSSGEAVISKVIMVDRFRANRVLQEDRILYRQNENEVNYYEYERWTSPPVDLVTNYFLHHLKDSAAYANVSSTRDIEKADYKLRGRLRRFEEADRGKQVSAEVALEVELVDARTGQGLWRGEEECSRPITVRTVAAVVQGIQQCLDDTANKLLNSMQDRILKKRE
ncbi:MAG: ABC-type transport auxiliary lipoprotein family protein [Acidobacteriia bacterium]|nr:ABC-type transport auxiliary lipoprotein family protein [Terriglobia bacterium]